MEERPPFRVAKETVGVVIRTLDQVVIGHLHTRPHKRLKDELNMLSDRYIAVTGARVYDASGSELLYEARFLLLATAHIISVTPLDAVGTSTQAPWFRGHGH